MTFFTGDSKYALARLVKKLATKLQQWDAATGSIIVRQIWLHLNANQIYNNWASLIRFLKNVPKTIPSVCIETTQMQMIQIMHQSNFFYFCMLPSNDYI